MRTTLDLDDQLLTKAKEAARVAGTTLTAFVEDALRARLARRSEAGSRPPVRLPVVGGNGLLPGVDLDDSAALRELMDRAERADAAS